MIEKIISGGQTGVDLAALDAATMFQIAHGGSCPKGRINEKGIIPPEYQLIEIIGDYKLDKENYDARTRLNIEHSDGTLILVPRLPLPSLVKDGTLLTIEEAKRKKKPYLEIDLSKPSLKNIELISDWLEKENIHTLNVAGPRESTCPGIYQLTTKLLVELFQSLGYSMPYRAKL